MRKVDVYIESLPEEKGLLMQQLRELILNIITGVEERFSYGLPFYHYHGMFCYLKPEEEGVAISFLRGKDLLVAFPQLQQKNRAIVASVTVSSVKDFTKLEIPQLIAAAAEWNKEAKSLKMAMVKRKMKRKV
jgi:uncharacterized protein